MARDLQLPEEFRARIVRVAGDAGRAWLERLPETLDEAAALWELRLEAPFELWYGYVTPVTRRDGSPAVLKARVPDWEFRAELHTLLAYNGEGAAHVLAHDESRGLMLIERLMPGTMLSEVEDDAEATAIAVDVGTALRRPPPREYALPTLRDWARAFGELRARSGGGTGPLPAALVERAEETFARPDETEPVLLHGDLHHWNILRAERAPWLAIDPHGVIGDAAFEAGPYLRNQIAQRPDARALLAQRVAIFEERGGFERRRLLDWAIAHCALSACWSTEGEGEPDAWAEAAAVAEWLAELERAT